MLLTKHEGETFHNQTIYISGQAFIRCNFVACTLVLRETVYHMEACAFERCNWHVDVVLMWGSPESLREIKSLLSMLEQSQQGQQLSQGAATPGGLNPQIGLGQMGAGQGGQPGGLQLGGRPVSIPPISSIPPIVKPVGGPPRISSIPPIVPRNDAKNANAPGNGTDNAPAGVGGGKSS